MNRIAVLMSTYNGEKYLREQLDSLLNQKGVISDIFVRDDGSCDGTKNILCEYEEKHSNIHLLFGKNIGVGNSFMNLLYSIPDDYDYYAFSDQDDIWEDVKLTEGIKVLEKSGRQLYASNMECVDKDGTSLGIRFTDDTKICISPINILGFNMLAGCTLIMTNKFYKFLSKIENRPSTELLNIRIHDVWCVMVAAIYDEIIYDEKSFIKYRQHNNNASGGVKVSRLKVFKTRVKKIFNKKLRNCRSRLAKEICLKFPDRAKDYPELKICADANKFHSKKWIIKNNKLFTENTNESSAFFILKVLLNLI